VIDPMYKNLRTNLPREIMAYREKQWGNDNVGRSFVTHQEVLSYLEEYANEFDLNSHIQYGCKVTQMTVDENATSLVSLIQQNSEADDKPLSKVNLTWEKLEDNTIHSDEFDAVCVCNGHYAIPSVPKIPGLNEFKGEVIHSVEYDEPSVFANKTVMCIGASASGADIAREVSMAAKKVYLSDSNFPKENEGVPETKHNVTWLPRTQRVEGGNKICFADDCTETAEDVDVIIVCTGYDYNFPFINEKSNLNFSCVPGEKRLGPLYKQLWHAEHPNIAFFGILSAVVPFPLFEIQAEAVCSQLIKTAAEPLPSFKDRVESAEKDFNGRGPNGTRIQDTHWLSRHQWGYCRMISKMSDCYNEEMENYISTTQVIAKHVSKQRFGNFPAGPDVYRLNNFIRDNDNKSYEVMQAAQATN